MTTRCTRTSCCPQARELRKPTLGCLAEEVETSILLARRHDLVALGVALAESAEAQGRVEGIPHV